MSNWLNRLELKDLWKAMDKNEITIQQLAKQVAKRIRRLKCYKANEEILEELAYNFENCEEDVEEFDNWLSELYDFGDTPTGDYNGTIADKLCWINTR